MTTTTTGSASHGSDVLLKDPKLLQRRQGSLKLAGGLSAVGGQNSLICCAHITLTCFSISSARYKPSLLLVNSGRNGVLILIHNFIFSFSMLFLLLLIAEVVIPY